MRLPTGPSRPRPPGTVPNFPPDVRGGGKWSWARPGEGTVPRLGLHPVTTGAALPVSRVHGRRSRRVAQPATSSAAPRQGTTDGGQCDDDGHGASGPRHHRARARARTAATGAADLDLIHEVAERLIGRHDERHRGQAGGRPHDRDRPARRGSPAHRGRPRRRQDDARQGAGPLDRLHGAPHPVHARPAAERRHRRQRSSTRTRADFEFRPGAMFANVVVGDEINRASPKTQSALLECMEERQVTVDGTTYPLRRRSW